jgi:hypothetical protein
MSTLIKAVKTTKESCCCTVIHQDYPTSMRPLIMDDDCCSQGVCNDDSPNSGALELRTKNKKSIYEFFRHVKNLYAAALGIEILCIAAAEIGENTGLYVLGFNHIGVPVAYAMGYCLGKQHDFHKYGSL